MGVSPVQNQGSCGSCWAFATTAAVETAYAIKHGFVPKLSEQQLVSCDTRNYGCGGGWMQYAFEYLKTVTHNTEAAYPYYSGSNGYSYSCNKALESGGSVRVSDYHVAPANNPTELKKALT